MSIVATLGDISDERRTRMKILISLIPIVVTVAGVLIGD